MFNEDSKTRQEIRQLQKRLKHSPTLFARLGECYLQLGDWEHAEKILLKGVEDHPEYTTGLLVLGEGYLYKGLYRDAGECARKGLDKQPSHLGLLRLMEKVKKFTGEIEGLEKVRGDLKKLDPLADYGDLREMPAEKRTEAIADFDPNFSALGEEITGSRETREIIPETDSERHSDQVQDATSDYAGEGTDLDRIVAEAEGTSQDSVETSADEKISDQLQEELKKTGEPVIETLREPSLSDETDESEKTSAKEISEEVDAGQAEDSETEKPSRHKRKIATKTLGELYATQKKFDEAIEIYEKLLENDPSNEIYRERLEDLKIRRETALSENVE